MAERRERPTPVPSFTGTPVDPFRVPITQPTPYSYSADPLLDPDAEEDESPVALPTPRPRATRPPGQKSEWAQQLPPLPSPRPTPQPTPSPRPTPQPTPSRTPQAAEPSKPRAVQTSAGVLSMQNQLVRVLKDYPEDEQKIIRQRWDESFAGVTEDKDIQKGARRFASYLNSQQKRLKAAGAPDSEIQKRLDPLRLVTKAAFARTPSGAQVSRGTSALLAAQRGLRSTPGIGLLAEVGKKAGMFDTADVPETVPDNLEEWPWLQTVSAVLGQGMETIATYSPVGLLTRMGAIGALRAAGLLPKAVEQSLRVGGAAGQSAARRLFDAIRQPNTIKRIHEAVKQTPGLADRIKIAATAAGGAGVAQGLGMTAARQLPINRPEVIQERTQTLEYLDEKGEPQELSLRDVAARRRQREEQLDQLATDFQTGEVNPETRAAWEKHFATAYPDAKAADEAITSMLAVQAPGVARVEGPKWWEYISEPLISGVSAAAAGPLYGFVGPTATRLGAFATETAGEALSGFVEQGINVARGGKFSLPEALAGPLAAGTIASALEAPPRVPQAGSLPGEYRPPLDMVSQPNISGMLPAPAAPAPDAPPAAPAPPVASPETTPRQQLEQVQTQLRNAAQARQDEVSRLLREQSALGTGPENEAQRQAITAQLQEAQRAAGQTNQRLVSINQRLRDLDAQSAAAPQAAPTVSAPGAETQSQFLNRMLSSMERAQLQLESGRNPLDVMTSSQSEIDAIRAEMEQAGLTREQADAAVREAAARFNDQDLRRRGAQPSAVPMDSPVMTGLVDRAVGILLAPDTATAAYPQLVQDARAAGVDINAVFDQALNRQPPPPVAPATPMTPPTAPAEGAAPAAEGTTPQVPAPTATLSNKEIGQRKGFITGQRNGVKNGKVTQDVSDNKIRERVQKDGLTGAEPAELTRVYGLTNQEIERLGLGPRPSEAPAAEAAGAATPAETEVEETPASVAAEEAAVSDSAAPTQAEIANDGKPTAIQQTIERLNAARGNAQALRREVNRAFLQHDILDLLEELNADAQDKAPPNLSLSPEGRQAAAELLSDLKNVIPGLAISAAAIAYAASTGDSSLAMPVALGATVSSKAFTTPWSTVKGRKGFAKKHPRIWKNVVTLGTDVARILGDLGQYTFDQWLDGFQQVTGGRFARANRRALRGVLTTASRENGVPLPITRSQERAEALAARMKLVPSEPEISEEVGAVDESSPEGAPIDPWESREAEDEWWDSVKEEPLPDILGAYLRRIPSYREINQMVANGTYEDPPPVNIRWFAEAYMGVELTDANAIWMRKNGARGRRTEVTIDFADGTQLVIDPVPKPSEKKEIEDDPLMKLPPRSWVLRRRDTDITNDLVWEEIDGGEFTKDQYAYLLREVAPVQDPVQKAWGIRYALWNDAVIREVAEFLQDAAAKYNNDWDRGDLMSVRKEQAAVKALESAGHTIAAGSIGPWADTASYKALNHIENIVLKGQRDAYLMDYGEDAWELKKPKLKSRLRTQVRRAMEILWPNRNWTLQNAADEINNNLDGYRGYDTQTLFSTNRGRRSEYRKAIDKLQEKMGRRMILPGLVLAGTIGLASPADAALLYETGGAALLGAAQQSLVTAAGLLLGVGTIALVSKIGLAGWMADMAKAVNDNDFMTALRARLYIEADQLAPRPGTPEFEQVSGAPGVLDLAAQARPPAVRPILRGRIGPELAAGRAARAVAGVASRIADPYVRLDTEVKKILQTLGEAAVALPLRKFWSEIADQVGIDRNTARSKTLVAVANYLGSKVQDRTSGVWAKLRSAFNETGAYEQQLPKNYLEQWQREADAAVERNRQIIQQYVAYFATTFNKTQRELLDEIQGNGGVIPEWATKDPLVMTYLGILPDLVSDLISWGVIDPYHAAIADRYQIRTMAPEETGLRAFARGLKDTFNIIRNRRTGDTADQRFWWGRGREIVMSPKDIVEFLRPWSVVKVEPLAMTITDGSVVKQVSMVPDAQGRVEAADYLQFNEQTRQWESPWLPRKGDIGDISEDTSIDVARPWTVEELTANGVLRDFAVAANKTWSLWNRTAGRQAIYRKIALERITPDGQVIAIDKNTIKDRFSPAELPGGPDNWVDLRGKQWGALQGFLLRKDTYNFIQNVNMQDDVLQVVDGIRREFVRNVATFNLKFFKNNLLGMLGNLDKNGVSWARLPAAFVEMYDQTPFFRFLEANGGFEGTTFAEMQRETELGSTKLTSVTQTIEAAMQRELGKFMEQVAKRMANKAPTPAAIMTAMREALPYTNAAVANKFVDDLGRVALAMHLRDTQDPGADRMAIPERMRTDMYSVIRPKSALGRLAFGFMPWLSFRIWSLTQLPKTMAENWQTGILQTLKLKLAAALAGSLLYGDEDDDERKRRRAAEEAASYAPAVPSPFEPPTRFPVVPGVDIDLTPMNPLEAVGQLYAGAKTSGELLMETGSPYASLKEGLGPIISSMLVGPLGSTIAPERVTVPDTFSDVVEGLGTQVLPGITSPLRALLNYARFNEPVPGRAFSGPETILLRELGLRPNPGLREIGQFQGAMRRLDNWASREKTAIDRKTTTDSVVRITREEAEKRKKEIDARATILKRKFQERIDAIQVYRDPRYIPGATESATPTSLPPAIPRPQPTTGPSGLMQFPGIQLPGYPVR